MDRSDPRSRSDVYGSRINRAHSPVLAYTIPYLTIGLASLIPLIFMATGMPLVPPLALMLLLAWRMVRPGLIPVWAGFPLGLWDDLFSGQPFGSGILLFSLVLVAVEILEERFPWRTYWQDWFTAGIATVSYLLAAAVLSGASVTLPMLVMMGPQLLLSLLLFPMVSRMVARLDRLRLIRFRTVG